jgi:proteasome assembly chaperone (PAC2) family protein
LKKHHYKINEDYSIQHSTLIICWDQDVGYIGQGICEYIDAELETYQLGQIEPDGFYAMDGVVVNNNLAQFPDNRFTYYPQGNLVIFKGTQPDREWYDFLSTILDVAQNHCGVSQIYTTGGMISVTAHTAPRELITVANSPEMSYDLMKYDPVTRAIEYYETPPGHRPTINAYLLWMAQQRNLDAGCLWIPIPFYLAPGDDPQAIRRILDFLTLKINLNIDFGRINDRITVQNEIIAQLRDKETDIDNAIGALEGNLSISGNESQKLITTIQNLFKGNS